MPSYSMHDVLLVQYPFTDLLGSKVRPAVVVSASHISQDIFIVPLTSQTASLLPGEFVMSEWAKAGLNVQTAVKRGIFTVRQDRVLKRVGKFNQADIVRLAQSLRSWLGL